MIVKCDFCKKDFDTRAERWLFQDDGSYIQIDCIEPALEVYKKHLDEICPTGLKEKAEAEFKLASKIDPREPYLEGWHETCEWCGHITDSPNETHVCSERV